MPTAYRSIQLKCIPPQGSKYCVGFLIYLYGGLETQVILIYLPNRLGIQMAWLQKFQSSSTSLPVGAFLP